MKDGLRNVGSWVVLILVFIFLYNFFEPGGPVTEVFRGLLLLLVVGTVAINVRHGKRFRLGLELNAEGSVLMSRGRIAAALEKFEAARPLLKKQRFVLDFNVGLCHLYLWRLHEAERELMSAQGAKELPEDIRKLLPPRLALVSALQGEEGEARERLEESRRVDSEVEPLTVLAEGAMACRRGEWAEARRLLEGPGTHSLGGPLRGLRDALLAWSVEQTRGERRYVDPVTVFGEASIDSLREAWPELVDFLLERARQVV